MSFGLAVSDYSATTITGACGKIVKLDISSYLPKEVLSVQGEDAATIKCDAEETPTADLETLMNYLEDTACPDIAFYHAGETLWIFFKDGEYDTRFSFIEKRDAIRMAEETDELDVPRDLVPLFKNFVIKLSGEGYTRKIDFEILRIKNDILAED